MKTVRVRVCMVNARTVACNLSRSYVASVRSECTRLHGCDTDHAPSGCDSESTIRIKFGPTLGLISWTQILDPYRGLILSTIPDP